MALTKSKITGAQKRLRESKGYDSKTDILKSIARIPRNDYSTGRSRASIRVGGSHQPATIPAKQGSHTHHQRTKTWGHTDEKHAICLALGLSFHLPPTSSSVANGQPHSAKITQNINQVITHGNHALPDVTPLKGNKR